MDTDNDFGLSLITGEEVPLEGVKVKAYINGRGSKVIITQMFKNTGKNAIEAVYKFPLPSDSAVCGFRAIIGDRIIRGEIEEKEKAFKIYDEAMAKGDGAYLLDEERPNIFTLSVGNLNPQRSAIIEVEYVSLLDSSGNGAKFYLPTTISPRYIPDNMPDQNGIPVDETINPLFAFDVDYGLKISVEVSGKDLISSIDCPSHKLKTSYGSNTICQEFSSDTVKMDRDFVLNIAYREDLKSRAYYFEDKKSGVGFVELDLSPRTDEKKDSSKSRQNEIIFVLDCSGSMEGSSIVQAKNALEILLRAMKPGDKFNIYRFGSTFNKFCDYSVVYDDDTFAKALAFIKNTEADLGGTEILAPLNDLFKGDDNKNIKNIILITDGEVGNEDDVIKLVKLNSAKNRLFTVGIGYGPNEYFIKGMADATGAASQIVHPEERIEPKILGLFNNLSHGRIENIKIDWEAGTQQSPSDVVLFEGGNVSVFAKTVRIPEKIKVSGMLDDKLLNFEIPVICLGEVESPIPQLWAREAIKELESGMVMQPGSAQTRRKEKSVNDKVIEISKEFGVISRLASFVSVEERSEEEKTKGAAILKKIPVMLTKDWHGLKAGVGAPAPLMSTYDSALISSNNICEGEPPFANNEVSLNKKVTPDSFRSNSSGQHLRAKAFSVNNKKVILSNDREELLLEILSLQKPSGGFEISEEILKALGIDYNNLKETAKKIIGSSFDNKFTPFQFLYSLVILEVLKSKFSDKKDSWEAITGKTENWLNEQNMKYKPLIGNQGIPEFIKKNVLPNLSSAI